MLSNERIKELSARADLIAEIAVREASKIRSKDGIAIQMNSLYEAVFSRTFDRLLSMQGDKEL